MVRHRIGDGGRLSLIVVIGLVGFVGAALKALQLLKEPGSGRALSQFRFRWLLLRNRALGKLLLLLRDRAIGRLLLWNRATNGL
jgi:hypothetical protein